MSSAYRAGIDLQDVTVLDFSNVRKLTINQTRADTIRKGTYVVLSRCHKGGVRKALSVEAKVGYSRLALALRQCPRDDFGLKVVSKPGHVLERITLSCGRSRTSVREVKSRWVRHD
jgi:hypothetical protein